VTVVKQYILHIFHENDVIVQFCIREMEVYKPAERVTKPCMYVQEGIPSNLTSPFANMASIARYF